MPLATVVEFPKFCPKSMSHFWLLNQQKPSPTISFGKWEHSSLCISLIKGNFSKKDDVLMPENWLRFELGPASWLGKILGHLKGIETS